MVNWISVSLCNSSLVTEISPKERNVKSLTVHGLCWLLLCWPRFSGPFQNKSSSDNRWDLRLLLFATSRHRHSKFISFDKESEVFLQDKSHFRQKIQAAVRKEVSCLVRRIIRAFQDFQAIGRWELWKNFKSAYHSQLIEELHAVWARLFLRNTQWTNVSKWKLILWYLSPLWETWKRGSKIPSPVKSFKSNWNARKQT